MTIFYFTSTGNSLAAAKKIAAACGGAELISIPKILDSETWNYADDVIGLVFPIYGFGLPLSVRRFMAEIRWTATYAFAVGTYGNLAGACMRNLQRAAQKKGIRLDYAESLLTVDNYLPGFEINKQIESLPKKKTEENLARIIDDVKNRRILAAKASAGARAATAVIQWGEGLLMSRKQAKKYRVNPHCTQCGVCEKVCPSANITVDNQVHFGERCEGCLGCVHLCPQKAIHLKHEKSDARWLNPETTLNEIIKANHRGG